MRKKTTIITALSALLVLAAPYALAEDATMGKFMYPFFNEEQEKIVYYNQPAGSIESTTLPREYGVFEKEDSIDIWFDRFAEHVSWSPDGGFAAVKARNTVPPNIPEAEVRFFSPNLEINSVNWWIYNLNTQETIPLNQGVSGVGWFSDDEIIYTLNHREVYTSSLDNLENRQKLVDLRTTHEKGLPPVYVGSYIIMPFDGGIYLVNESGESSVFYDFDAGNITKAVTGAPENNLVLLLTDGSLAVLFDVDTKEYKHIAPGFIPKKAAFYDNTNIFFISEDDRLHAHNTETTETLNISRQDIEGEMKSIHSFGEGRVVISTTENMYLYAPPSGLGLSEAIEDGQETSVWWWVLGIFFVLSALGVVIFLRKKTGKQVK